MSRSDRVLKMPTTGFQNTTEHNRVYVIDINKTDGEVLHAYLSRLSFKLPQVPSYAPGCGMSGNALLYQLAGNLNMEETVVSAANVNIEHARRLLISRYKYQQCIRIITIAGRPSDLRVNKGFNQSSEAQDVIQPGLPQLIMRNTCN